MANDTRRPMSADGQVQAVQRVLEALDLLVTARAPITGSEIGQRLGVHQTTASRLMRSLVAAGYARPAVGGGFEPGLRAFALGAEAADSFPLVQKLRPPMRELAQQHLAYELTLATLWDDQPLYFLRTLAGHPIPFSSRPYPLHQSAASLRLLLDRPAPEALQALDRSRERWGWARPTENIPADAEAVLAQARHHLHDDTLVLTHWLTPNHLAGVISLDLAETEPFVLSMVSTTDRTTEVELRLALAEARRLLETHH